MSPEVVVVCDDRVVVCDRVCVGIMNALHSIVMLKDEDSIMIVIIVGIIIIVVVGSVVTPDSNSLLSLALI